MVSTKAKRPRPFKPMSVQQWAAEYPEAKVTRRELYAVLVTVLGVPKKAEEAEPVKENEA